MNSVENWLVQNKDKIEKGVELMGQASEVLAATVGQLHPILEAVFVTCAELLNNPEGKEARYMTQQFEQVNQKLEGIQGEINEIALELQRTSMNKQNFDREAQILSQYEKFQDFVNAKPKFKEKKMKQFITQYENTDGDLNLDSLYNAVTGTNISGDPMLETVVTTEQRSRRAVEDFCARLKKLFVVGIIAVMGYAALKEGKVGEEMVKKWQDHMEDVEKRMKEAVDDCTDNFAQQAKMDMEGLLLKNPAAVNQEFIKELQEVLIRKYDWVNWSIMAFNDKERIFFFNWLAGKKYHGSSGANWFDIFIKNKIKVVVSFCIDPKPINKAQIREEIEQQSINRDMTAVAQSLKKSIPCYQVHAISIYKKVVETNNFHEDCFYIMKHKGAYLCIHPE
ncbi:protein rapunzel-like [Nelusetta ayraudi]|uniref:protein rapunzel-like n=1 Tax=Nelusetta ayraudi TaxID=303726 RepID=UPI003F6F0315